MKAPSRRRSARRPALLRLRSHPPAACVPRAGGTIHHTRSCGNAWAQMPGTSPAAKEMRGHASPWPQRRERKGGALCGCELRDFRQNGMSCATVPRRAGFVAVVLAKFPPRCRRGRPPQATVPRLEHLPTRSPGLTRSSPRRPGHAPSAARGSPDESLRDGSQRRCSRSRWGTARCWYLLQHLPERATTQMRRGRDGCPLGCSCMMAPARAPGRDRQARRIFTLAHCRHAWTAGAHPPTLSQCGAGIPSPRVWGTEVAALKARRVVAAEQPRRSSCLKPRQMPDRRRHLAKEPLSS